MDSGIKKRRPQLSIKSLSYGVHLPFIKQHGLTAHPAMRAHSLPICRGPCALPLLLPAASLACPPFLLQSQQLSSESPHATSSCVTPTPFHCGIWAQVPFSTL